MLDSIFQKLSEYYPQIATYFIIVLVVAYTVFKLTCFYKDTKGATSKFPGMETTLNKIDRGLDKLNQSLLDNKLIKSSCYSNENSPRVVNDLGKKLLEESGANKLMDKIGKELMTDLESRQFDSLLEMERSAYDVITDKMNDVRFKDVQNFVFEYPSFDNHPLTYTDLLFAMSLKLRDKYREKHQNSDLESDLNEQEEQIEDLIDSPVDSPIKKI